MNKSIRITLIALGLLIAGSAILVTGIFIGRVTWNLVTYGPASMMSNLLSNSYQKAYASVQPSIQSVYVPRGGSSMMTGYSQDVQDATPCTGGFGRGAGNWNHFGMMGDGYPSVGECAWENWDTPSDLEPLSLEKAYGAVEDYLVTLNNPNLLIKEVMIFDNHAYAEISEESTGIGAMEVLVDPGTLDVYPEHGPNMMWNLKYGMTSGNSGYGMRGHGMMDGYWNWGGPSGNAPVSSADMPVKTEEAIQAAQKYLDTYLPGTQADEHADRFYGYYTLHIQRNGETIGMLSVNGYNAQVFPHTWHGNFIAMSDEH